MSVERVSQAQSRRINQRRALVTEVEAFVRERKAAGEDVSPQTVLHHVYQVAYHRGYEKGRKERYRAAVAQKEPAL